MIREAAIPIEDKLSFTAVRTTTRRRLLGGVALAAGGLAVGPAATSLASGDTAFMRLSRLLIAHRLDATLGARLATSLGADSVPLSTDLGALLALAESRNARIVEDFLPAASEAQQASARRIISAWYLGTVNDVAGTNVIAYELALMFQPVRDVMSIPTYAIAGPNGWSAQAPPLTAMPTF